MSTRVLKSWTYVLISSYFHNIKRSAGNVQMPAKYTMMKSFQVTEMQLRKIKQDKTKKIVITKPQTSISTCNLRSPSDQMKTTKQFTRQVSMTDYTAAKCKSRSKQLLTGVPLGVDSLDACFQSAVYRSSDLASGSCKQNSCKPVQQLLTFSGQIPVPSSTLPAFQHSSAVTESSVDLVPSS